MKADRRDPPTIDFHPPTFPRERGFLRSSADGDDEGETSRNSAEDSAQAADAGLA